MKLKLFIIMLIAVSFAVTGLLGGCGGKKNKDKQDDSISIQIYSGQSTKYTHRGSITDGTEALAGYDSADNLIWLAVYRKININKWSTDTLYVLSGVEGGNDQDFYCYGITTHNYLNFTATSFNSNIAKLNGPYDDIDGDPCYSTTSYDTTGEAKISITTANGKKTWFTVIVVDDMDEAPEFTPNGDPG